MDRDGEEYRKNYFRVPRQPFFAWLGIVSCTLLVISNGWYVFWQIHHKRMAAPEAAGRLIGAYAGVSPVPFVTPDILDSQCSFPFRL